MPVQTQTVDELSHINKVTNLNDIKEEILVFLRNYLTDRKRRTTVITENFSGNGVAPIFTLTQDLNENNKHTVKNVKYVKVDGIELQPYIDYKFDYNTGKITFYTAPSSGTNNIFIEYACGQTFGYRDLPRFDLTSKSYPRFSIQILSSTKNDICVGGGVQKRTVRIEIPFVETDVELLENSINEIDRLITNHKRQFFYFDYINNINTSQVIEFNEDPNDVVFLQTFGFDIPNVYEFSL